MTVVKSVGSRFVCYEPLIKKTYGISIRNGCMSQRELCQRITPILTL